MQITPGFAPHAVDVVHQQDRVVDHDAAHHDDPHVRLPGERRPRVEEHQEDPDQRHGHREKDAKRQAHRLEERGGHHVDEEDRHRQHGVDLPAVLVAPPESLILLDHVANRQFGGLDDAVVVLVAEPARSRELVRHPALVLLVLAADPGEHVHGGDGDHVAQADAGTGGGGDDGLEKFLHVGVAVPLELHLVAHLVASDLELGLAGLARDGGVHARDQLLHRDVVARQLVPLDLDHELGRALSDESPGGVGVDGAHPRHAREPVAQIFGDLAHALVIVPQYLHGVVRRSASASAVESQALANHPHLGPGEAQAVAEHLFLDGHRDAGVLERIGEVDGDLPVRARHPRGEAFHLRNRGQPLLEGANQVVGALQVGAARQFDIDENVGVQAAHSPAPEHAPGDVVLEQIPRPAEGQHRHRHRQPGAAQGEADDGRVDPGIERRPPSPARRRTCGRRVARDTGFGDGPRPAGLASMD